LNLSYFISKRIRTAVSNGFSSAIHRIAIVTIALGLAAALVSFLIMLGFQNTVKDKVFAFSSHLLVTRYSMSNATEEQPFDFRVTLFQKPDTFPFVRRVQPYAHKAGLIKTDDEVLGIIFKGITDRPGQDGLRQSVVEGRFIAFQDSAFSREVLLSRVIANKIRAKVGDALIIHFLQDPPRSRRLNVVGIYETNLSDYFDSKHVIGDLKLVQQLNGWKSFEAGGLEVVTDINYFPSNFLRQADYESYWQYHSSLIEEDPGLTYWQRQWEYVRTWWNYSFDYDRASLDYQATVIGQSMDFDLRLETARDKYIQVFEWLGLIGRQVKILLVIILLVVCVNMISVVLILVMERTPMIGMLKAMGAPDRLVRSVFVYNGVSLIVKGLAWGNLVGLGLCLMQDRYRLLRLNPHDYYMDYVPVDWHWPTILALNVLTLAVVTLVLLVPTALISRIHPIRAIRFD
jgi:lipoprotein-releasing system permease protein